MCNAKHFFIFRATFSRENYNYFLNKFVDIMLNIFSEIIEIQLCLCAVKNQWFYAKWQPVYLFIMKKLFFCPFH